MNGEDFEEYSNHAALESLKPKSADTMGGVLTWQSQTSRRMKTESVSSKNRWNRTMLSCLSER